MGPATRTSPAHPKHLFPDALRGSNAVVSTIRQRSGGVHQALCRVGYGYLSDLRLPELSSQHAGRNGGRSSTPTQFAKRLSAIRETSMTLSGKSIR